MDDHHHDDHDHDHSELSDIELRVRALESILTEKGYPAFLTLGRCIGALSESKLLCNNDLASFGGSPRCRRSVAQTYLVLHPLRAVGWRRVSTAGRSPPMPARFCSGRPTASSAWLGALQAASWMRAGRT